MSQQTDFHQGKFGALVQMIAGMIKRNPELADNMGLLEASVFASFPALRDRSRCANCDASMREYVFSFDAWDALLLLEMAKEVRHRTMKGMPFTEANAVRVPDLNATHAIKCRTTQCSKLGLLARYRGKSGLHTPGVWLITRRGWEAVAGKPVPAKVRVWRKKIEERFEETTTIQEALKSHVDWVESKLRRGKQAKEDHREAVKDYQPQEWYEFSFHSGAII